MKQHGRMVVEIARWEFSRFFKWRDQLVSLVILLLGMGFGALMQTWQRNSEEEVKLAVVSAIPIPLPDRFKVESAEVGELEALKAAVRDRKLDGVLILAEGRQEVVARRQVGWIPQVESAVTQVLQADRLGQLNVDPLALAQALQPVKLQLVRPEGQAGADGAGIFAMAVSGIMLMALLTGLSYLWIGLTGEKQNRVTEQLFSIVPAQAIIDGKLLGIALITLNGMVQLVLIGIGVGWFATGGLGFLFDLFRTVTVWEGSMVWLFALLGFAFWFSFCAMIFTTINDPASSQRNSLLFLPMGPIVVGLVGIGSPDSLAMQVLSIVPLTSMSVMPIRLLLGEPAIWEVLLAVAVLVLSVLWTRRAAAKVFTLGMLMYGKEPSWREILRWAR